MISSTNRDEFSWTRSPVCRRLPGEEVFYALFESSNQSSHMERQIADTHDSEICRQSTLVLNRVAGDSSNSQGQVDCRSGATSRQKVVLIAPELEAISITGDQQAT